MFDNTMDEYDHEFATVRISYEDDPANPRTDETVGTLLAHCQGYTLGDDDSELKSEWDYVVDLYCAYRQGWSLGAALAGRHWCEDSGMISFPANSGEIDFNDMPYYCVLIPVDCGAGSYSWCRAGEPVIGRANCVKYIRAILDGEETPSGMYAITAEDILNFFGEVTKETIDSAAVVALNECEMYDAYLKGEVYSFYVVTDDDCEAISDFYDLDECRAEAEAAAIRLSDLYVKKTIKEEDEAAEWSARGVVTV